MDTQNLQEFKLLLLKNFPNIYQSYSDISVDYGWQDIVYQLSDKTQQHNRNITVHQVTQELGGLRFYYSPEDAIINGLLYDAVKEASKTCEKCGQKGILLNNEGVFSVLCPFHHNQMNHIKNSKYPKI